MIFFAISESLKTILVDLHFGQIIFLLNNLKALYPIAIKIEVPAVWGTIKSERIQIATSIKNKPCFLTIGLIAAVHFMQI